MIVLDTNVLSELMRADPDPTVLTWLDAIPSSELATTAVTAAELRYGAARLPSGRRRATLVEAIEGVLGEDLAARVEPFDLKASMRYAEIVVGREQLGRPIGMADAQIAAICLARGHRLATRNTQDFGDTGVELVNPWLGQQMA